MTIHYSSVGPLACWS